jgi:hypothetical protein
MTEKTPLLLTTGERPDGLAYASCEPAGPKLVEIPKARAPFELWATIKQTSKYYRQGVDERGKPLPFPIDSILLTDADSYDFKGGPGGAYRREDLQLWIACGSKLKRI